MSGIITRIKKQKSVKNPNRETLPKTTGEKIQLNHKITDLVPGLIAVYDIRTGDYMYVNNAVSKILGYSKKAFLSGGISFVASLVHPDDITQLLKENNQALKRVNRKEYKNQDNEPITTFEYRMKHKDDSWRWLKTDGVIFDRDAQGKVKHVMNISVDITERKEAEIQAATERKTAEESLQESEEQLRAIWESVADGIALSDPDGIVVAANKAYYGIYGYSPEEIIGKSFVVIFPPDKQTWAMAEYKKIFTMHKVLSPIEAIIYRKDGVARIVQSRYSFVMHNKKKIAMISIVRDITEQKKYDLLRLQQEKRFRMLIENNSDAIALVSREGVFTYISPSVKKVLGYNPQDLLGRNSRILFPQQELKRAKEKYKKVIQNPGLPVIVEHKAIHKDGSFRWIESTTTNYVDNPDIQGYVSNFRDITQRKKAEEMQGQLAAIVASSDDAIIGKTLNGIITSWNKAAARIFGYTATEAIGKNIILIVPPELYKEEEIIIRKLRKNQHIDNFETTRVTKSGKRIAVSLTISPIISDEGEVIGASKIARDISEKKKDEERQKFLNQVNEKLAISLNHNLTLHEIAELIVPFLADYCRIALVDSNNTIKEIVVNHEDPSKVSLTKELYDEYINQEESTHGIKHILQSGKPEMISIIDEKIFKSIEYNPALLKVTKEIGLKSYMGVPLLSRGKILGAITFSSIQPHRFYNEDDLLVAQEVAGRIALTLDNIQLYRKVIENERLYRLVVENTKDLITLLDPQGTLLYISPSWKSMLGYTPEDLIGKQKYTELVHPEDLSTARETVQQALNGKIMMSSSLRIKHKKGNWVLLESIGSAVFDEQDRPSMVVMTSHDVTERTELERRKDDFISMASHELKTPVTSMTMFIQLLQRYNAEEGDTHALSLLEKMDKQMKKMTKLIGDLLDLSKIQAGRLEFRKEVFIINDLVKEIVDTLQPTTNKHKFIVGEKIEEKVFADRDRIGQVLINLITNAIKYSPRADKIVISSTVQKNEVVLHIRDFGIGITARDQEKIFERFFRAEGANERTYPGFGIGLYISQEIIKKHNGTIWVSSEKGKGSTFSFSLPIANT